MSSGDSGTFFLVGRQAGAQANRIKMAVHVKIMFLGFANILSSKNANTDNPELRDCELRNSGIGENHAYFNSSIPESLSSSI